MHKSVVLLCTLVTALTLTGSVARAQSARPNIVLILADDLGYGDPGSYNPDSKIPTPAIDRLAREGIRFTDAHTPSAVCTPTRYGLLTGRYAWRSRLKKGVLQGYDPLLIESSRMTLASLLKGQGYRTAGIGKWHLGLGDTKPTDYRKPLRPGPMDLGFDSFFGIPASLDFEPYVYIENDRVLEAPTAQAPAGGACCFGPFWRAGAMSPGFRHEQVLPEFVSRSIGFLEQHAHNDPNRPFFLYLALSAPHTPWLPLEPFRGKSGAGDYGDFVVQVDDAVRQVLQALDRLELADNTLVIFTSDNGAIWSDELIANTGHRPNASWRGQKADIWEAGHRVPFLARWPGNIRPGSRSAEVLCLTDMLTTFAALTGARIPENAGEDSFDLSKALLGAPYQGTLREATVHHSGDGVFAIRQGPWKLIEGLGSGGFTQPKRLDPAPNGPKGQLYNLESDPGETTNLYNIYPEEVRRLQVLLNRYREQGFSRQP